MAIRTLSALTKVLLFLLFVFLLLQFLLVSAQWLIIVCVFLTAAALSLLFVLEGRLKEEQKQYQALQKSDDFLRLLRHELMNQFQVMCCLSQMGKNQRLERSLWCLHKKLKIYSEINRFGSPQLQSLLGRLIFSLPTEVGLSFEVHPSYTSEYSLSPPADKLIESLAAFMAPTAPENMSLNFLVKQNVHILEIALEFKESSNLDYSVFNNAKWQEYFTVNGDSDVVDKQLNLCIPVNVAS